MDQTQLQEKIVEYYKKLPADVSQAFASMSWMEALKIVSIKYGLNQDQIVTLGTETTLALLGIIDLNEYEDNLRKEIRIVKESFNNLLIEIENTIFKTVRPQLFEAYNSNRAQLEPTILDPRFTTLPESLQNAIRASGYQKKLYDIGTKHKLQVGLMTGLEEATIKLIGGMISPSQYENELMRVTDLSPEKVKDIAHDVNEDIFLVIRQLMQEQGAKVVEDDEVPIPPYVTRNTSTPKTESGIFANSGIEMVQNGSVNPNMDRNMAEIQKETVTAGTQEVRALDDHSTPNEETEKEMLRGIEHPENVATSIIGDKLKSVTISKNTTTDYSLPKISQKPDIATTPSSKAHDPYREVI